jgi:mono/diheme cytochrome c family protein
MISQRSKTTLFYFSIASVVICVIVIFAMIREGNKNPGQLMYKRYCENCHLEDGLGLGELMPPLAGSDYLRDRQDELPCMILNGMKGEIMVNGVMFNEEMPPAENITSGQILNIINYVNNAWGNDNKVWNLREVNEKLEECP